MESAFFDARFACWCTMGQVWWWHLPWQWWDLQGNNISSVGFLWKQSFTCLKCSNFIWVVNILQKKLPDCLKGCNSSTHIFRDMSSIGCTFPPSPPWHLVQAHQPDHGHQGRGNFPLARWRRWDLGRSPPKAFRCWGKQLVTTRLRWCKKELESKWWGNANLIYTAGVDLPGFKEKQHFFASHSSQGTNLTNPWRFVSMKSSSLPRNCWARSSSHSRKVWVPSQLPT